MSDAPTTSARHNLKAESRFSSAKKTITARHLDVGLARFDQTETSVKLLPQPLTPRVNTLRLAQASFPQIEFQPEETAPTAETGVSFMSLPDRLQWNPPEEVPRPYLQVGPPLPARHRHPKAPIRRIGWVSAGNPEHFNDRNCSLGPESFSQFFFYAELRIKKELALHWAPRRRMAQCSDLQPVDHSPPLWSRSGRMVDRRAASDPLLHPGQLGRVAALELEAAGGLSPDCASER
jgi:hypothetical protein